MTMPALERGPVLAVMGVTLRVHVPNNYVGTWDLGNSNYSTVLEMYMIIGYLDP